MAWSYPVRVEPKCEQTIFSRSNYGVWFATRWFGNFREVSRPEGESRPIRFKTGLGVRFGSDDSRTPKTEISRAARNCLARSYRSFPCLTPKRKFAKAEGQKCATLSVRRFQYRLCYRILVAKQLQQIDLLGVARFMWSGVSVPSSHIAFRALGSLGATLLTGAMN